MAHSSHPSRLRGCTLYSTVLCRRSKLISPRSHCSSPAPPPAIRKPRRRAWSGSLPRGGSARATTTSRQAGTGKRSTCCAFSAAPSQRPRRRRRRASDSYSVLTIEAMRNYYLAERVSFTVLHREDQEVSNGLNWAIAGKGVIVKDKLFYNLGASELQKGGAIYTEHLSGIPLHVKGNVVNGIPDVSRAQFAKLLKLVTFHLSSISSIYVQDGAVGSSAECDAKARVISDNPSAVLLLSNILWKIPDRAMSHDTCPLTIYVASSISTNVRNALGSGALYANGFAAADVERSSLILCGKAFADSTMVKGALTALAAPILSARGSLPVPGWLLSFGGSSIMLFAPVEFIKSSEIQDALVSTDNGVAISSKGCTVLFPTKEKSSILFAKPISVIIVSSDSTDALPSISKLSPGQAAYHFLAGYQDGKFIPAYNTGPSPADPLALANSLFLHLKEDNTSTYMVNAKKYGRCIDGKDFMKLLELMLSNNLPHNKSEHIRARELKGKYRRFLSAKFGKYLPEEFSF